MRQSNIHIGFESFRSSNGRNLSSENNRDHMFGISTSAAEAMLVTVSSFTDEGKHVRKLLPMCLKYPMVGRYRSTCSSKVTDVRHDQSVG